MKPAWRCPLVSLLLAGTTATCAHRDLSCDHSPPPPPLASPTASAVPPGDSPSSASAPQPAPPAAASWVDAVRIEDWDRASALLAALDPDQRARPEIRYVTARVELARKRHAQAASLLEGLEAHLPELAADIAFHRAEAQLHAGPVDEAAAYFASRTGVVELVKAARAFEQIGDHKRAREAVERAIRAARRSHDEHAVQAHELRARLAEAAGEKAVAIADLQFVARYAPFADQAEDAIEGIRRLDPSQVPTAADRIERAARMVSRGDSEQALDELDKAEAAPGKAPSPGQLTLARARALYGTRSRYDEAARLFEQAAKMDPSCAPEALYFAAKAWSRADRNDLGLDLYARVTARFPKTPWAERAAYQRARLLRLDARWAEAAAAYSDYLARYRRGASAAEARYELALALLISKRSNDARKRLQEMLRQQDNRTDAAALRELVGVAAFEAGDTAAAFDLWRAVIRDDPLSFPALTSAARLRAAGQSPPPAIQPGPPSNAPPVAVPLPRMARLLHDLGLDADAEAWIADNEDALVAGFGARTPEARCALYANLDRARRLYRVGQRFAPLDQVMYAPSSANRWAWQCLFPTPYSQAVQAHETTNGIPRGLIHAVIRQESGFNPDARSPVGALGLMQLMPVTARKTAALMDNAVDPDQVLAPAVNLALGARYLGRLLPVFQGQVPLAVAAYNAGPKAVAQWVARAQGMPLDVFVAQMPFRETRRYVWRVMGNYARYALLFGGLDALPVVDLDLPTNLSVPDDPY
jgi:soluble lytic murein transglycosylase